MEACLPLVAILYLSDNAETAMSMLLNSSLFRLVNWVSRTFFASRLSYAHLQAFLWNNSWKKFTNLLRVHWDISRGRTNVASRPYIFILEVTNVCNLKCPFCLTGKGISGGREVRHMGYEEAREIIDAVADYIYLLQLYTWGEPLLNKDLIKIIEYSKSRNISVMLSTNATAMTPAYNARLIASGLDYITVAVDGGSEESYVQYRVGGSYEKVLANIRDLLEQRDRANTRRPFVEWQFIVFRHNEHEVASTEAMAYKLGIDKFTPLPAYVEDEAWLPQNKKYRKTSLYNPERLKNCQRPWSHLNVRADGGVAPCCYEFFKKDDFGTLGTERFGDIWNNALFQESRKLIHQFGVSKGKQMDDSNLICHGCLKSGIRPSYVEKDDVQDKPGGLRKTIPIREVSS
jgi:MoaA/NifB/PqqE/SkfB family radical SAM enzyme